MQLADYVLLVALVMLVHVLANHKYMGHLIVVLYFVLGTFMGQLGLEHNLYQYGSDAGMHLLRHEPVRSVPAAVLVVQGVLGGVGAAVRRCSATCSGSAARRRAPAWRARLARMRAAAGRNSRRRGGAWC